MTTNNQILEGLRNRRKPSGLKTITKIGLILRGINEATVYDPIIESKKATYMLRELTYDDVTSKYFK
jgi:hypothetical protein